tara:strand:+ start:156 stop:404 length:249 start_codon:yes stop_codon:yes gene_type:complete
MPIYKIERGKGNAKCYRCSSSIPAGMLRIGTLKPGPVAGGRTFTYFHNSCLSCQIPQDCRSSTALEGYHALNENEKKQVGVI